MSQGSRRPGEYKTTEQATGWRLPHIIRRFMDIKKFEQAKYLRDEINQVDAQYSWLTKQPKVQPESHGDYDRLLQLASDLLKKYKDKLEAEFNAL